MLEKVMFRKRSLSILLYVSADEWPATARRLQAWKKTGMLIKRMQPLNQRTGSGAGKRGCRVLLLPKMLLNPTISE